MTIAGTLYFIGEIQTIKEYVKKEFVLFENEKPEYPNYITFELFGDKAIKLLDGLKEGQEIKVDFNVKGRKWEKDGSERFFNTLSAWKIETPKDKPAPVLEDRSKAVKDMARTDSEDLPF